MTPVARRVATLHNQAGLLSRTLRALAGKIQDIEEELEAYRKENPK